MERHSRVHLDHPGIRGRVRTPELRRARIRPRTDLDGKSVSLQAASIIVTPPISQIISESSVDNAKNASLDKPKSTDNPSPTKTKPVLKIRTVALSSGSGKSAHMPRQMRSGVLRRQMVKSSSKKFKVPKHRSFKPYLISGLALFTLVMIGGIGFAAYSKLSTRDNSASVLATQTTGQKLAGAEEGTSGSDLPSESNPPIDINGYSVAENMPRYLIIDTLGVKARVRRVGSDNNNNVKGPSNIFDTGWYENSSLPGENGTALIDGHVAGQTKRGVFYGLSSLKKGDKVVVERGDGKHVTYSVVITEQADFDKLDMKKLLNSANSNKPGLNLMTASGRFNIRTNQFEKRVIVYAVQD